MLAFRSVPGLPLGVDYRACQTVSEKAFSPSGCRDGSREGGAWVTGLACPGG